MNIMLKTTVAAMIGAVAGLSALTVPAKAQEPILGQLQQFGTYWCPEGWMRANGQLLAIAGNEALYSLLGTTYGGNGTVTFALPDLRERAPVSQNGQLPIGAMTGHSQTTLISVNLPSHTHQMRADASAPATSEPNGSMLGTFTVPVYAPSTAPLGMIMHPLMVQPTGGNQSVSTQSPILATNWCIAMEGIYPQRPD